VRDKVLEVRLLYESDISLVVIEKKLYFFEESVTELVILQLREAREEDFEKL